MESKLEMTKRVQYYVKTLIEMNSLKFQFIIRRIYTHMRVA